MSSLAPVHTTPHTGMVDAIKDALNNSYVLSALSNLPSFRSDNYVTPGSTAPAAEDMYSRSEYFGGGSVKSVTVGAHNLVLTDSNSKLTIKPGSTIAADEGRTVVVVGGDSKVTFGNDAANPAFGYDIVSGEGTNTISLNNGPSTFQSTTGNDLVKSGGGADTISGGSGHDTIYAGGQSFVTAGSAGDKIFSSTLTGGSDTIQAGPGSDTISLQAGDNSVIGSTGDTKLQAGTGNDTFDGSTATGNESILGGTGNLSATLSNVGNDTIFGQAGHDISVTLQGESAPTGPTSLNTDGSTTINFAGGQTIIVKNVNITFDGGVKQHF